MANTNPTDYGDDIYFVVKREIDGNTVRYVEILSPRFLQYTPTIEQAFFVDCGITYDGAPATVITGLDHLEGEDVAVLADGNVISGMTVASGQITLPNAYSVVHVGLPFVSEIDTLNLEVQSAGGTIQDRRRSIDSVMVRLQETREFWIGPDEDHLEPIPLREDENFDEATQLFSGDKIRQVDGTGGGDAKVYIKNVHPVPVTILAIIPRVDIGGI